MIRAYRFALSPLELCLRLEDRAARRAPHGPRRPRVRPVPGRPAPPRRGGRLVSPPVAGEGSHV